MPAVAPEIAPNSKLMREATLLIKDSKTIWLELCHVDWCVKYLYAQNMLKGVDAVADDSPGPSGSCPSETDKS